MVDFKDDLQHPSNTDCVVMGYFYNQIISQIFNTMSKKEKENYDVLSLCKSRGRHMFIIAFWLSMFMLNDILMIKSVNIELVLLIFSIIYLIIYSNYR